MENDSGQYRYRVFYAVYCHTTAGWRAVDHSLDFQELDLAIEFARSEDANEVLSPVVMSIATKEFIRYK